MIFSIYGYADNGRALFQYCKSRNVRNCYYYDFDAVRSRTEEIASVLSPSFKVLFSLKSNSNPQLAEYIARETPFGADVSSASELDLACSSGFNPSDVFFVGPGKSLEELLLAVEKGVGGVIVESLTELKILDWLGKEQNKKIEVLLRVNPSYEIRGVRMAMGGVTQFGMDEETVMKTFLDGAKNYPNIEFAGVHIYVGTRILKAEDAVWNIAQVLNFVKMLDEKGIKCKKADVGGGLGIPYYDDESPLDISLFKELLHEYLASYPESIKRSCMFYLEAGRYIVGPVGCFIARVDSVIQIENCQEIEVEATPALHALSEGSILTRNKFFVGSTLCEDGWKQGEKSTDIFYKLNGRRLRWPSRVKCAALKKGEYIVFLNSGAYGPATSPVWKNLEGYPLELAGSKGLISEIRAQMTWKDLANEQLFFAISQ